MPRKLKTYQTSLGFYDLAIAAPSMKAALEAWGADSNLFHQGVATESEDSDVIAATMAAPGVVLKRPVGSSASFKEHAELPTGLLGGGTKGKHGKNSSSSRRLPPPKINEKAARKAAAEGGGDAGSQATAGGGRLGEGARATRESDCEGANGPGPGQKGA
jgi:colicin import membrane protein